MNAIIETSLAFPTVVFTVLLGFVLLYAALVILGAFDLEFLDGFLGLESLEGSEGVVDGVDGAIDGGDAGGGGTGILAGIMASLGVAGVPITVWGSVLVLLSWMLSMIAMQFAAQRIPTGFAGVLVSGGIGLGAFLVGGFIASRLVRPLRKVYVTEKAPRRSSLVGRACTVLSSSVDATSGRGEIADGGSGFIAEIRCDRPNDMKRGDRAVVFDYDPIDGIFHIAPEGSELSDLER